LLAAAIDAPQFALARKTKTSMSSTSGAFELPLAAKKLAATGRTMRSSPSAASCAVKPPTTIMFAPKPPGFAAGAMDTGLPIIFCVLTCDTLEQAIDRAGLKGGNKGFEAGLAAIEMAQLSRKLVAGKSPVAATKTFPPQKARRK